MAHASGMAGGPGPLHQMSETHSQVACSQTRRTVRKTCTGWLQTGSDAFGKTFRGLIWHALDFVCLWNSSATLTVRFFPCFLVAEWSHNDFQAVPTWSQCVLRSPNCPKLVAALSHSIFKLVLNMSNTCPTMLPARSRKRRTIVPISTKHGPTFFSALFEKCFIVF